MSWRRAVGDVLEAGSNGDFVTPMVTTLRNLTRRHHTFVLESDCGYSGRQIQRALRNAGIRTWGWDVIRRQQFFCVDLDNLEKARRILNGMGIDA